MMTVTINDPNILPYYTLQSKKQKYCGNVFGISEKPM